MKIQTINTYKNYNLQNKKNNKKNNSQNNFEFSLLFSNAVKSNVLANISFKGKDNVEQKAQRLKYRAKYDLKHSKNPDVHVLKLCKDGKTTLDHIIKFDENDKPIYSAEFFNGKVQTICVYDFRGDTSGIYSFNVETGELDSYKDVVCEESNYIHRY